MTGTMTAIWEEAEDTADVAAELTNVVVTGARVIGLVCDPSVMISLVAVVPDSTIIEVITPTKTPEGVLVAFPLPVAVPVPAEELEELDTSVELPGETVPVPFEETCVPEVAVERSDEALLLPVPDTMLARSVELELELPGETVPVPLGDT